MELGEIKNGIMEQEKLDILKALSECNTSNQWSMLDAVAKKVNKLMLHRC